MWCISQVNARREKNRFFFFLYMNRASPKKVFQNNLINKPKPLLIGIKTLNPEIQVAKRKSNKPKPKLYYHQLLENKKLLKGQNDDTERHLPKLNLSDYSKKELKRQNNNSNSCTTLSSANEEKEPLVSRDEIKSFPVYEKFSLNSFNPIYSTRSLNLKSRPSVIPQTPNTLKHWDSQTNTSSSVNFSREPQNIVSNISSQSSQNRTKLKPIRSLSPNSNYSSNKTILSFNSMSSKPKKKMQNFKEKYFSDKILNYIYEVKDIIKDITTAKTNRRSYEILKYNLSKINTIINDEKYRNKLNIYCNEIIGIVNEIVNNRSIAYS